MYNRILLPTDGSDLAARGVDHGLALARVLNLPVTVVSVIVPLTKAALVATAVFISSDALRKRTLKFVELIAKWSMADVFAVALFIVYLAAQATQQPPGAPEAAPPLLAFTAQFGPGFYWFAAYCLFSLASQQYTRRLALRSQGVTL